MVVCPSCGKENDQPDAAYCLYCGSSLRQQPSLFSTTSRSPVTTGQAYGSSRSSSGTFSSTGIASYEVSARYQKEVAKVARLGNIVIALAVITLILIFL